MIERNAVALHVSADGIHIVGAKGAVTPGGVTVVITNVTTGKVTTVKAGANGSFDAHVDGSANDAFVIRAGQGAATSVPVDGGTSVGAVSFNLAPDSNCAYAPQSSAMFYPTGRYDISPGGNGAGKQCANPYVAHLLVNSHWKPNPAAGNGGNEVLQLHSAEVTLMSSRQETIVFDRGPTELPNPFVVSTNVAVSAAVGAAPSTGIAAVEVIPVAYASQLDHLAGQILASIRILGTTTSGSSVSLTPFVYPIEICDGCLTLCSSKISAASQTRKDVVGNKCDDNSGTDDRICIDPDC